MEIDVDLKIIRFRSETSWRQIAVFVAFLIGVFGGYCIFRGVDKEVALAVVAALGVIAGAFVTKPRGSSGSGVSSHLAGCFGGCRGACRVVAVILLYSSLVYCLSLVSGLL